ncbi:MAG: hypothetical protein AAGH15_20035 [Myxococcota bacterium]
MDTADGTPPDEFEGRHMTTRSPVLKRDKLASRTMAGVLGGGALLTFVGFVAAAVVSGTAAPLAGLLASATLGACALTLSVVRTVVSAGEVQVRLGLWGPHVAMEDVLAARVRNYPLAKYGGWGIKRGWDGSMAYTILGGTRRVVELTYRDGGREHTAVFSASDPEGVVAAIARAKGLGPRARVAEAVQVEEVPVEAAAPPGNVRTAD